MPHGERMSFEEFWSEYPRKTAKQAAMKAFARLTAKEKLAAMVALPLHCAEWQRRGDIQYTPHAATWIRGKRWEDELKAPVTSRPKVGSPEYYAQRFDS